MDLQRHRFRAIVEEADPLMEAIIDEAVAPDAEGPRRQRNSPIEDGGQIGELEVVHKVQLARAGQELNRQVLDRELVHAEEARVSSIQALAVRGLRANVAVAVGDGEDVVFLKYEPVEHQSPGVALESPEVPSTDALGACRSNTDDVRGNAHDVFDAPDELRCLWWQLLEVGNVA